METGYTDDMVQIENVSLFASGPLDHAVTTGMQVRKHQRDVDMWMPGKTYEVEKYNYGHYQPSFMPKGKVDTHSFYLQDAISLLENHPQHSAVCRLQQNLARPGHRRTIRATRARQSHSDQPESETGKDHRLASRQHHQLRSDLY